MKLLKQYPGSLVWAGTQLSRKTVDFFLFMQSGERLECFVLFCFVLFLSFILFPEQKNTKERSSFICTGGAANKGM